MIAATLVLSRCQGLPSGRTAMGVRAAARTMVSFVAAAAMLLQLGVAVPLASRMLAGTDAAAWPPALCAMRTGATDPAPAPRPPVSPRDHGTCPLCQSHGVPLGILAAALLFFAAPATWRSWLHAAVTTPPPVRRFRLYGSRAPPAFA